MNELTVINYKGKYVIDSRIVAEMVEKNHAHLLRDIQGYAGLMATNPDLDSLNFFVPDTYQDAKGVESSGKKMEEVADMLGISLPTLFRQRKGKSKNSFTEKECICRMVEEGITEPEVLPTYCHERCLIGKEKEKRGIRFKAIKKRPRFKQGMSKIATLLYHGLVR